MAAMAGMLAGGAMTFRYAIRAGQASGERSLQAQLLSAEQGLKMRLEAEARRRMQEKLEESYGKLMGWFFELDMVVDSVWIGIHSTDQEIIEETRMTLHKWPWVTLKPPQYVASTQQYWSVAVRDLIEKFYGDTVDFVKFAQIVIRSVDDAKDGDDVKDQAMEKVWEGRGKLRESIAKIREQAGVELMHPERDLWQSIR
ncbi:hypothetical protein [Amycolatopsis lurida]|uniref:hypothetical protein n=1 Tax=Amycolatopsis lurida TaxID=31959 RepID=UPI00115FB6F0|nr:hypothetical protein [Amycolatopsis lurida]